MLIYRMRKRLTIMPPWAHDYESGLLAGEGPRRTTRLFSLLAIATWLKFFSDKRSLSVGLNGILAGDGAFPEKWKRSMWGGARSRRKGSRQMLTWRRCSLDLDNLSSHTIAPTHLLRGGQLSSAHHPSQAHMYSEAVREWEGALYSNLSRCGIRNFS
jgi:hypothetical protein